MGDPAAYFHHNVNGGGLTYCYPNLGTTLEAATCIPNALYRVEWRVKTVPITVLFQFYDAIIIWNWSIL